MPVPNVSRTTRPSTSPRRAVVHLGQAGRVGIVEHDHRAAGQVTIEQLHHVAADPRGVDVVGDPATPSWMTVGTRPRRGRPTRTRRPSAGSSRRRVGGGGLRGRGVTAIVDQLALSQSPQSDFDVGAPTSTPRQTGVDPVVSGWCRPRWGSGMRAIHGMDTARGRGTMGGGRLPDRASRAGQAGPGREQNRAGPGRG